MLLWVVVAVCYEIDRNILTLCSVTITIIVLKVANVSPIIVEDQQEKTLVIQTLIKRANRTDCQQEAAGLHSEALKIVGEFTTAFKYIRINGNRRARMTDHNKSNMNIDEF